MLHLVYTSLLMLRHDSMETHDIYIDNNGKLSLDKRILAVNPIFTNKDKTLLKTAEESISIARGSPQRSKKK